MSALKKFIDRFKHEAKPKVAINIPRPCAGTTNYLLWLRWKEKFPGAEFTSYNGLFLMAPKTNN